MDFDFSWVDEPTPEQLEEEGANYTAPKGAGAYPGYRKNSPETNKKISESLKGNIPWNKGKKGQVHSEETKQKMSDAHKGQIPWNKGIITPEEIAERKKAYRKAYYERTKK